MNKLWAPWRIQYIEQARPSGCILCDKPRDKDDEANLLLYRGRRNFVLMNLYPYNPGHLMVAPYRHLSALALMTRLERAEHYELVSRCVDWLTSLMKPHGFNIGMNLGQVAGAGIEDHIHSHVVPRWNGDTNFMPVVGDTKVVSESLAATYRKLKKTVSSASR